MSLKGVSFTTAQKLSVGDMLELNILLTDGKNPAQAQGQVRWVEESHFLQVGNKVHYDAGVEITDIDNDNLKALENYMRVHEGDQ